MPARGRLFAGRRRSQRPAQRAISRYKERGFLRRFCMHILPKRFVKIRYFGILTSSYRKQVESLKNKPDIVQLTETPQQRIVRLTGFDNCKCPRCKTGTMQVIETLPPIRSPDNVFYTRTSNLNL